MFKLSYRPLVGVFRLQFSNQQICELRCYNSSVQEISFTNVNKHIPRNFDLPSKSWSWHDMFLYSTTCSAEVPQIDELKGLQRPLNQYTIFFKEAYPTIANTFNDGKQTKVVKEIAVKWKSMSDEEKEPYQKMAFLQKSNYEEKRASIIESMSGDQVKAYDKQKSEENRKLMLKKFKKRRLLAGQPKIPMNPFILFRLEEYPIKDGSGGRDGVIEMVVNAAEVWRAKTDKEKSHYRDKYEQLKKNYESEKKKWLKQMKVEGKLHYLGLEDELKEPIKKSTKKADKKEYDKEVTKTDQKKKKIAADTGTPSVLKAKK